MVTFLRPDADDADGAWTNEAGGTSLFASVDDTSANDADYIQSSADPIGDICRFRLSNPATVLAPPGTVRVRYKRSGSGSVDLTVRLKQDTTEIASWVLTDISSTFTTTEQTLTTGQYASITDFNNLFVELQADVASGAGVGAATAAGASTGAATGVGAKIGAATAAAAGIGAAPAVGAKIGAATAAAAGIGAAPAVSASEWPDASNTGVPAGTTLTNTSGRSLNTASAIINAENISGTLTVNANNITIKNCKISASGFWAIRVIDGIGGTIIQDCEIDGLGDCGKGIRSGGATGNGTQILRCNIHDMADGIDITGDNVLIQDCYIHNFRDPEAVPHYDGIVNDGGANSSVVRHNYVDASIFTNEHVNSNISFNDYWDTINAPTVDNNLMKGGSGNNRMLEFYGSNHAPDGCTNVICTNNHFVPNGAASIVSGDSNVTVTTWSGNINDTSGATITNPY